MSNYVTADSEELKSARKKIKKAYEELQDIKKYETTLEITPQKQEMMKSVKTILSYAISALNQEKMMLNAVIKEIENFDDQDYTGGKTSSNKGSSTESGVKGGVNKLKKSKKTSTVMVMRDSIKPWNIESLLPSILPVIVIDDLRPTVDLRTQELKNFEKYLQSGNLSSAVKSYKTLKVFGFEGQAQELLTKYGYKVEEKNGEYIISKITEETTPLNDANNNQNSNTDGDVVAEVTPDTETQETPKQDTVVTDNNEQNNQTVVTPTNNNNNNGGNNTSYNNTQTVVENTSTDVSSSESITQPETETTTEPTTNVDDTTKDTIKEETKTNVVNITDDSKTTTTKKSSGLGAAVPIGLGTIAAGTAAVAGVRYVKNRHDNQEEYDENYDDENNDLDSSNEYVDTAQYDSESSYMDDDYLGPINNSVDSEDSYVDPEELEDIDSFSEDSVLEDLNSNY